MRVNELTEGRFMARGFTPHCSGGEDAVIIRLSITLINIVLFRFRSMRR
jgi:hypothetical protein